MSDKIEDRWITESDDQWSAHGGPAFPASIYGCPGMSLRDWFAGQALVGVIAFPIPGQEKIPENAARECYAYADAMLAARKGKGAT